MKRLIYITFACLGLLLVGNSTLFGQSKDSQKEERVKAQKIAFFTEKLNLTPEEAQQFWPVYNEYWEKKDKIINERREAMKYCNENIDNLSDKEMEKYNDMYIDFLKQESDLLIDFSKKLKKVLSPEKVLRFYFADYEFKSYLLRQIRNAPKKEE
ncbi:MAG TPA: hypothetical protein PKL52_01715 [Tenuifilaceae bacterium]|nr:hypothetical protein [Tenuifilaceae bacterium]